MHTCTDNDNILIEMAKEITIFPSLDELFVQEVNISIADDTVVESTEQVVLFLSATQDGVLVENGSATINIFNDDSKDCW